MKIIQVALLTIGLAFGVSASQAQTAAATGSATASASVAPAGNADWKKDHPRRAEVNNRLANQNKRISEKVQSGEMSQQQAASLRHEDRQIRKEERMMASQNNGHITKAEKKALNQQENAVSRQIGK